MVVALSLIVLRCGDLAATKCFYEALGLVFHLEKHGSGPEHWSCRIGDTVLELYPAPAGAVAPMARLGLRVSDVRASLDRLSLIGARVDRPFDASTGTAVVVDPGGTKLELSEVPSGASAPAGTTWAVWRQDDNGNQFRISGGHTREEADRLCSEFEARGHKQLYWVSPAEKRAGG